MAGLLFACLLLLGSVSAEAAQWISLGLNQESYFARQEALYGTQSYQLISGRYRGETFSQNFAARVDGGGFIAANVEHYSAVYVPEAWVQFRQSSVLGAPKEISVGRKREAWSQLDEHWDLGLWQPLFRYDYLRPEDQGLTGAFLTWKSERASLTVFGSYLYIPEQGPPYEIEDEKISSMSPWFSEPPSSLILFAQETDIRYTIEMPEISDIVLQPSAGLLASLGARDAGPWGSAGYVYKPRNNVAIPFKARLEQTATSSDARVDVYPHVEHHHLVSLDTGYAFDQGGVFLTSLAEFPVNAEMDPELTRQRLEPQYLVSPGIEGRVLPSLRWGPKLTLAYLYQDGGGATEEGPFASSRGQVFGSRLPITRAMSVGLQSTFFRTYERSLDISVRWIEDFRQRGTVLMSELRFRPARAWTLALSADVLGSRAPESDTSGMITRFRGNDRVSGGILYVF